MHESFLLVRELQSAALLLLLLLLPRRSPLRRRDWFDGVFHRLSTRWRWDLEGLVTTRRTTAVSARDGGDARDRLRRKEGRRRKEKRRRRSCEIII